MTTLKAIKMFGVFPGQWLRETMKIALKLTPMRPGRTQWRSQKPFKPNVDEFVKR
jgi:hypothetical protein